MHRTGLTLDKFLRKKKAEQVELKNQRKQGGQLVRNASYSRNRMEKNLVTTVMEEQLNFLLRDKAIS
jgi:hypothetical protein